MGNGVSQRHLKNMEPGVSVIMPVYNGELYLRQAIDSILNQAFRNFEFIIIDDGSSDNTLGIIESYNDKRILCLKNNVNEGVAKSLNRGLKIAQGKFIARMDADDISLPLRLEKQVAYLNEHSEIGMVGSRAQIIDEQNNFALLPQPPVFHAVIIWTLIFNNCMIHSSVIFRRALLEKVAGYSQDMPHGEDYDLWVRMGRVTGLANLSEILVYRRIHNRTIENRFSKEQGRTCARIIRYQLMELLNRDVSDEEVSVIAHISKDWKFKLLYEVKLAIVLITGLFKIFLYRHPLSKKAQNEVYLDAMGKIWNILRNNAAWYSLTALWAYRRAAVLNFRIFVSFIACRLFNKINRQ